MAKFKHCYIRENNEYCEIPYESLYRNGKRNTEYKDRYFLPIHGCLMEVPLEDYKKEYRVKRREKYIREESTLHGEVSYHGLDHEDINGEELLRDYDTDVENEAITQVMVTKLHNAIKTLKREEQELIIALYFKGKTQVNLERETGVKQQTISYREIQIRKKLKKVMEK